MNETGNMNEYYPLKINEQKIFEINSEQNKKFNVIFSNAKNNNLLIKAFYEEDLNKIEYNTFIDLNEIQKKKTFSGFKNINDYLKGIYKGMKNEKVSIIERENDIELVIPIDNENIKKINFKLEKNLIGNKNDEIYDLYEYSTIFDRVKKGFKDNSKVYLFSLFLFFMFVFIISSLNNKINDQKKLIETLQDSIDSLKNQSITNNIKINKNISSLEQDNKLFKTFINIMFNLEQIKYGFSVDSKIINDDINSTISLKIWISPEKYINTKLLFRLSRDGYLKYHEYCDNITPTLTLIKLNNGTVMGGYTICNLKDINDTCIANDNGKSFLFYLKTQNSYDHYSGKNYYNKSYSWLDYGYISFNYKLETCRLYGKGGFTLNNNNNIRNDLYINEVEVYELIIKDVIE